MSADDEIPVTPDEGEVARAAEAVRMNRMRWNPSLRGLYEGWYVAFNDPVNQRGFWIRYSVLAPSQADRAPICQIWLMRTDRTLDPRNRAIRTTMPATSLYSMEKGFRIEMGGGPDDVSWGWLDGTGCGGNIRDRFGDVAWDLRFQPLLPPIAPTPEWGAHYSSCYLEPHPLVRLTGTVWEVGHRYIADGLLGQQAHVFGVRHSQRWHWAECKNLGQPGAAFVGVSSWIAGLGVPVTSVFLARGDSRPAPSNSLLKMLLPRTRHDPTGWRFTARQGGDRLVGAVTPRREDLVGVTYHDPTGQPIYCYHSELADMRIEVQRRRAGRWRTAEVLESPSGAAFEYGSAVKLPGVSLLLD